MGRRGLFRGSRPSARRLATFIAIAGTVAASAIFFVKMFQGADEADKYGRIDLPGSGAIELPEGRVALYYEEHVTLSENESLDVPSGLRVVARRENEVVKSQKTVHNAVNTTGRSLREFAKLEIPRAGRYRVSARSSSPGGNDPGVTLGKGQLEGLGGVALAAGGIEGGSLLLALLVLLAGRRGYAGERSSFPVEPSSAPVLPVPGRLPGTGALPGSTPPGSGVPPGLGTPAGMPATGDPLELQLRELERQHAAGALSDEDYAARRRAVLDAAFKR
ncbi:MAG TPA: hypothetical protein VF715_14005 [Thermoleophilaceae bacterium]